MLQNNQNQYTNENRKKQNRINILITAGIISGVAVIAAGILILMALIGRPASSDLPDLTATTSETSEAAASETGSMEVSGTAESSAAASEITLSGAAN